MIQLRFAGAPRVILARKRLPRLEGVDALGWGERAVYRIQTVLKRERERESHCIIVVMTFVWDVMVL